MTAPVSIQNLGRLPYADALEYQNQAVSACLANRASETLLLLEHEGVYTIGRTRDRSSLRQPESLPHPVIETNRGGQATWHGPGQLVAYPILKLAERGRDLHRYIRFLESVILLTCEEFEVCAQRRERLTGVWVGEKKIASIGVGLRHWISMHGLAFNVSAAALEPFQHITPCGIQNVEMTSLESELKRPVELSDVSDHLARIFLRELPALSVTAAVPAPSAPDL